MKLGLEASNLIDLGINEIKKFTITMFLAVNSIDDLVNKYIYIDWKRYLFCFAFITVIFRHS